MENKFTKAIKEYAKKNDIKFHFDWEIEYIEKQARDYNTEECEYDFEGAIKQAFEDYHDIFVVGN